MVGSPKDGGAVISCDSYTLPRGSCIYCKKAKVPTIYLYDDSIHTQYSPFTLHLYSCAPSSISRAAVIRFFTMSMDDNNIAASVNNLSLSDDVSTCDNCGKVVSNPNECNKCKSAKYCNAACKKKHRSKHKTECERRAAELAAELHKEQLEHEMRAAELHDEKLFKQPPPKEDCPICMLPIPTLSKGSKYKICCGKRICSGCIYAVALRDGGIGICPFCRTPTPTSEE